MNLKPINDPANVNKAVPNVLVPRPELDDVSFIDERESAFMRWFWWDDFDESDFHDHMAGLAYTIAVEFWSQEIPAPDGVLAVLAEAHRFEHPDIIVTTIGDNPVPEGFRGDE